MDTFDPSACRLAKVPYLILSFIMSLARETRSHENFRRFKHRHRFLTNPGIHTFDALTMECRGRTCSCLS